jgi:cystathionine beta-lyase family protein involved in aluminum resistance
MLDKNLQEQFNKIDEICYENSKNILEAFRKNQLSEVHFNSTTGYGYNDLGRDVIEQIFADVLGGEDSLVRNQFISGTHALTVALFGLLRPNETLLSITGLPYDTLHNVIGISENSSSLKSFGINYEQIDLINDDFDYDKIKKMLTNKKIKVIEIQRSKGYSTRKSINLDKVEKVCKFIKEIDNEVIIMVDNCYCELVTTKTPLHVGADLIVGSLIKNLGGGIAPNGAYIAGRKDLVELCAERLTVPGCGKEVGPSLGINKSILQGLYMAPNAVASSLKTAILAAYLCEKEGFNVEPKYNEERVDIVQNIIFNDPDKLIKFTQEIQKYSAVDSFATPIPTDMPGYDDPIIMASGSFTQGSSIEISCDGPIRAPYIAYLQGGLTFNYGKIAIENAVNAIKKETN